MKSKHDSLPTSKLVLWSASGFYKPALLKAEKWNIDTVTPDNIDEVEWSKLSKSLRNGTIELLESELSFFIDVEDDKEKIRFDNNKFNYTLQEVESGNTFDIQSLKHFIAHDPEVGGSLLEHSYSGKNDFWINYLHPSKCFLINENNVKLPVFRIGFGVKAKFERSELDTTSILHQGKVSTLAVGDFPNKKMEIFIEETKDNEPVVLTCIVKK